MQKLAILYDASQAVLSTFDLDEVLRRILSILRDYFQVQHSVVLLVDEQTGELCPRIRFGWPDDPAATKASPGRGLVARAAAAKHPIYLPDVRQDDHYVETLPGTRAELAIPLMVGDRVVGVLDCQSHRAHCFDEDTVDLLTLFSTQASIALRNAKLHELEQRRAAQLEILNAVARQTAAVSDLKELLRRSCNLLLDAFKVDNVSVLLLEDNRLVLRGQYGRLKPSIPEGGTLPADSGLCGRALAARTPVLSNDVSHEPDYVAGLIGVRSELCLPLLSFGHALGVWTLSSAQPGAFADSDIGTLESVADIFAGAIQNAIHFEQIKQLVYRDGLTGIFNRRFFEMRILEELERAKRHELVFSVLMIDLDGFKPINDEFGHLLGDEALRQISSILVANLRKADVVCRFGGDEFAILLPETNGENAARAAEKLCRSLSNSDFPGVPRPVTASIGAACFPEHGSTRDELVKAADDALYRAKQAGRNRLVVAQTRPGEDTRPKS